MKKSPVRAIVLALASVTLATTAPIVAQEGAAPSSTPEVGVLLGLTHVSGQGDDLTVIAVPGTFGGFGGPLYVSAPLGGRLSLRAESSFLKATSDGLDIGVLGLGGYAIVSLGSGASGPYALGGGSMLTISADGDSETEYSVGAGLGNRFVVGSGLVVRLEARYNRFVSQDEPPNIVQLLLGFGAQIG